MLTSHGDRLSYCREPCRRGPRARFGSRRGMKSAASRHQFPASPASGSSLGDQPGRVPEGSVVTLHAARCGRCCLNVVMTTGPTTWAVVPQRPSIQRRMRQGYAQRQRFEETGSPAHPAGSGCAARRDVWVVSIVLAPAPVSRWELSVQQRDGDVCALSSGELRAGMPRDWEAVAPPRLVGVGSRLRHSIRPRRLA